MKAKNVGFRVYLISFLVIAVPFLFFIYNLIPPISLLCFGHHCLDFSDFVDLYVISWYFASRALIILLLTLWFLTCRYPWYRLLLVLIFINCTYVVYYVNEILTGVGILRPSGFRDMSVVLVVSAIAVVLLIVLRKRLGLCSLENKGVISGIEFEMNKELQKTSSFSVKKFKNMKKEIEKLRRHKSQMDEKQYIRELIKIKESYNQAW